MPASSQTSDETNTTNNNNTREPAATSSSSTSRRGHAIATLNIANLIAYIANAGFVSSVPVLLKLPDNAEVSNKYQTLVTPAGFAFAIWGVIFLVQAIWSIVQIVVPTVRRNPLVIRGVGYHYVLVCACQVAWTFAFSLEQLAMSLFWMLGILFYLLRIYMAQDKVLSSSSHDEDGGSYSKNYWLLRFPFGLHFGWIVAASLVNVNLVLVAYDVSPDVQYATAIATLTAAVLASGFVLFKETQKPSPNVVVPLVLVWALNAIYMELGNPRDSITSTFPERQIEAIRNGSFASAMVVATATSIVVVRAIMNHFHRRPTEGESAESLLRGDQ